MKKLISLSVCLCLLFTAQSQARFNLFAGPQMSTAKYSVQGVKQNTESKYGFLLGAGWKVPFENRLYFAPAAFYSMKGYKVDLTVPAFPPDTAAINNDTRFHNLELAFLLQYDLGTKLNHFFIKAGPSLDFQLFGKEKFDRRNNKPSEDRDIVFGFGEYGRYAANMLLQFGYETSGGLLIFAQYTHGMTNINNADFGPGIRHRALGISIGKYLGGKR